MRIIAGTWRGRPIRAPKGTDTRPTTDRVREALMSSLISARGTLEGAQVLDAFAGSGALGLEVLSRGGRHAVLCERDGEALGVLRDNARIAAPDQVRIVRGDVLKHPPVFAARPFDLVFLDPPYKTDPAQVSGLVGALIEGEALADNALVCYEHDKKDDQRVLDAFDSLELVSAVHKAYGDTAIDIFRKESA